MSRRPPPRPMQGSAGHPLLPQAVNLHQAGRLAEAAKIYEQIVAKVPRQFDATHLLGVIALQEGRLEQAQRLITSALEINPKDAPALSNLGTVHMRNGRPEAALNCFERAVRLQPNWPDALENLGTALYQLGRSRDAIIPLRRAYAANPKSATLSKLLGACLFDTGDAQAAVKMLEASTLAAPDDAEGWANLAVALTCTGKHDRALECANKAIAIDPHSSAALAALAAAQYEQGQVETAIETYREAVSLPNPTPYTYCAFADALVASGLCEEGSEQFRKAIEIDTNNALARWKLAMAQCQPIYLGEAEIERSRHAFAKCLGDLQGWFRARRPADAYTTVGSAQPFYLAYQPFNNRDLLSVYGQLCVEWMATMPSDKARPKHKRLGAAGNLTGSSRKMRIGIASAHVREHSVWNAITKGWIHHLDKARFETYVFALRRSSDQETERARREVTHFEDQPNGILAWVRAIKEANLDVLIYPEIGMDPLTTQLASLRLAPVQAATWGHPETTGLPTMDLYLSAEAIEPVEGQGNYTERLVCLPNLGVYVEPLTPSAQIPDLRSLGLPSDEPLLLCPGSPFKYSPVHDRVWVRIAKGLRPKKGGRLVFFQGRFKSMDQLLEQRLRKVFKQERADFDARVCLIPNLDQPRFFGLMQQSALMLDTLGFSGFNTGLQAIECGLPVLAREGDFMRGRLASGLMRRIGLPELVASSDEEFIDRAVQLAADDSKRKALRHEITNRRQILYHDLEPVRALERCLTEAIVQKYGASQRV
jgi:protein O-GlcNAc transferase